MKALLFATSSYKVLMVFSLEPGARWRRKELQAHTRLPNVTLDKALARLQKAGVITKNKGLYALHEKRLASFLKEEYEHFGELPFTIHFALIDLAESFADQNVELILFGSYAKLTYSTKSDLDIAVMHGKKYRRPRIEKIEKRYGVHIELHEFEKSAFFKSKKDPLVKEILKNGKELFSMENKK